MFRTVVWASDGSEGADRALPYAKALATGEGRKLIAVHSNELTVGRGGGYPVLVDEDEVQAKIRCQVEDARTEGLDASLETATGAMSGAAHRIAELAGRAGADVIVVGTRGHAPVAGLLLGSVTQRLLHIAPCPVLAVPASRHAAHHDEQRDATAAAHE